MEIDISEKLAEALAEYEYYERDRMRDTGALADALADFHALRDAPDTTARTKRRELALARGMHALSELFTTPFSL